MKLIHKFHTYFCVSFFYQFEQYVKIFLISFHLCLSCFCNNFVIYEYLWSSQLTDINQKGNYMNFVLTFSSSVFSLLSYYLLSFLSLSLYMQLFYSCFSHFSITFLVAYFPRFFTLYCSFSFSFYHFSYLIVFSQLIYVILITLYSYL